MSEFGKSSFWLAVTVFACYNVYRLYFIESKPRKRSVGRSHATAAIDIEITNLKVSSKLVTRRSTEPHVFGGGASRVSVSLTVPVSKQPKVKVEQKYSLYMDSISRKPLWAPVPKGRMVTTRGHTISFDASDKTSPSKLSIQFVHPHKVYGKTTHHYEGVSVLTLDLDGSEHTFSVIDSIIQGSLTGTRAGGVSIERGDSSTPLDCDQSFTDAEGIIILPGDLIRTESAYGVSHKLRHVGMYAGNNRVIHVGSGHTIQVLETPLAAFEISNKIHAHYVHPEIKQTRNRHQALDYARTQVGEPYTFLVLSRNCESFATCCYTGTQRSHQGEKCGWIRRACGTIVNIVTGTASTVGSGIDLST